jgi:hypothetical protein
MRRVAIAGTLAVALSAGLSQPAAGGGFSFFDFDRGFYLPGGSAEGRTRVWFASEQQAQAAVDGQYMAYLLPPGLRIRPTGVPSSAIPLSPVAFSSPDGTTAIASLEFTVPDVRSGDWNVGVCKDPCTDGLVGDLGGGSIRVAASPEEAAIMRLDDRLDEVLRVARREGRRAATAFKQEVVSLRTENRMLARRIGELEAKFDESSWRPEPAPPAAVPAPVGWALVGLTILFGLLAFRPRRKAPAPPMPMDAPVQKRIEGPDREPALRR